MVPWLGPSFTTLHYIDEIFFKNARNTVWRKYEAYVVIEKKIKRQRNFFRKWKGTLLLLITVIKLWGPSLLQAIGTFYESVERKWKLLLRDFDFLFFVSLTGNGRMGERSCCRKSTKLERNLFHVFVKWKQAFRQVPNALVYLMSYMDVWHDTTCLGATDTMMILLISRILWCKVVVQ